MSDADDVIEYEVAEDMELIDDFDSKPKGYDLFELLHADRELTQDEMAFLTAYGNRVFEELPGTSAALVRQRNQIRDLWLAVEGSTSPADYVANLQIFRKALALDE